MNSSVMVVSMGMFPPIPNPVKAVRTRKGLYEFGAPRQIPKIEAIKTVRLKAHCRPVKGDQLLLHQIILKSGHQPTISANTPHTNAPVYSLVAARIFTNIQSTCCQPSRK